MSDGSGRFDFDRREQIRHGDLDMVMSGRVILTGQGLGSVGPSASENSLAVLMRDEPVTGALRRNTYYVRPVISTWHRLPIAALLAEGRPPLWLLASHPMTDDITEKATKTLDDLELALKTGSGSIEGNPEAERLHVSQPSLSVV